MYGGAEGLQDGVLQRAPAKGGAGPGQSAQLLAVLRKPDFLVTWLVPFVVFAGLTSIYTYGFMQLPSVCVILTCFLLGASIAMVLARRRVPVFLPLGVATFLSVGAATVLGLYVYDRYACFPLFYANSRVYTNVVPSQPSAAVADAGKITFAKDAVLAVNQSVAYVTETGYVYCVAPIRDNAEIPRVEFWAVGVECCDGAGHFSCDQAEDTAASAGIRIFDNSGFFEDSQADFYKKARLKAEATYGLLSVANPMYVRWVREDNLDMLADSYARKAAGAFVGLLLFDLAAAGGLAVAMYTPKGGERVPGQ